MTLHEAELQLQSFTKTVAPHLQTRGAEKMSYNCVNAENI